ncbi:MAG: efflux RND transporter periplasmic adaptor subunit [Thermoanaerobaculia bacterium]
MKKGLLIAGGAVVLAAIVIASFMRGGDEGSKVYMRAVERRDIARIVKASGVIDPRIKVVISPRVTGEIEKLYVQEGQQIESGELFAQLDQELFQAALDRAEAALQSAQAQAAQAGVRLENEHLTESRVQRLHEEQILSRDQLDQAVLARRSAELDLEQARQAVAQARADVDRAREDLRRTTLRAPLSGRVTELSAKEGEVVIAGTTNLPGSSIGTIADLSEILAEVEADETDVIYVELEQEATVAVDAVPDSDYRARVVEVGSSGFHPQTQPDLTYFKVKLLLEKPDAQLKPGMSARAEISTARKADTLVVPIQAVVRRAPAGTEDADEEDERDVVFVVEDDKVVQRPVDVGLTDATHAEILSGLEAGERVVTGPYRELRDLRDDDTVQAQEEPGDETDGDEEDGEGETDEDGA